MVTEAVRTVGAGSFLIRERLIVAWAGSIG
jgi:hypothetical protein